MKQGIAFTAPDSGLVSGRHPFRVAIDFGAAAGRKGLISISVRRRHAARGEPGIDRRREVSFSPRSATAATVEIEGTRLAPGDYEGRLTVRAGDEEKACEIRFSRMAERPDAEFPFGIYAVPFPEGLAERKAMLADVKRAGINLICQHMTGMGDYAATFDHAARLGMRFCPSTNVPRREWPAANLAQLASGEPPFSRPTPCLNQPSVREAAAGELQKALHEYLAHPAFSGLVYYGDDLFLWARCQQGKAEVSCYCGHCRKDFREKAGIEPPTGTESREGVVPAGDPWLTWMRYRCDGNYGGFVREIEKARKAVDASVRLGLCHGWPDNPFSSVITGLYAPLTQPTAVVSSYCYAFLRSPATDLICHFEIARMGNRQKDVWMLGLVGADLAMAPPWHVTQNYWNMLAAGYRFMAFFSWHDYVGVMKTGKPYQRRRARRALAALTRCGRHKDWILPVAKTWSVPPARFAVLYSFTTEAFDIAPVHRGNRHSREVCRLYRLALGRQLPMQIVAEEEIRGGILSQFDAICLHDVRVLPDDVRDALGKYVESGKRVFVDSDPLYMDGWHPNRKVEIKGALEASPETMIQLLCDACRRPVVLSNSDVTLRRFVSGRVEYTVFANNYPDRYWGMNYTYGDPTANYAKDELFHSEAVETAVTFRDGGRWLFDLETGAALGTTRRPLALRLEPAWGRVVAALPCRTAALCVAGPASVAQGEAASFALGIRDPKGRTVKGAFAVRIEIRTPSGRRDPRGGWMGLVDGKGTFVFRAGVNDEPGTWELTIEGGLPRRTVRRGFRVLLSKGKSKAVRIRAARG